MCTQEPTKATRGGGFVTGCDHDPDFAQTGTIANDRLAPQGTHDHPWVMQIDHGWLRTWVQLHGFEPDKATDHALQLRLALRSTIPGVSERTVVGGSSVQGPDGSIYLVTDGPKGRILKLVPKG